MQHTFLNEDKKLKIYKFMAVIIIYINNGRQKINNET